MIPTATLLDRYERGETTTQIAVALGMTQPAVSNRLRRAGIVLGRDRFVAPAIKQEIIRRYKAGETAAEIGLSLNRHGATIIEHLRDWGVPRRVAHARPGRGRKLKETQLLIGEYEAGRRTKELAKAFSLSHAAVCNRLTRAGVLLGRDEDERIYTLDECFFDVIDTEEKAYWLGFCLADGGLREGDNGKAYGLRVALNPVDRSHLVKLATALKTDSPIVPFTDNKGYESVELCVWSVHLAKSLSRLECRLRKTCTHGTPIIPTELYRHLYRGASDGDGCLTQTDRRWCYSLIGSPRFVADYQNWLMREANLRRTKLGTHGRARVVAYGGNKQVRRIGKLLYGGAEVYLDRKFALYCLLTGQHDLARKLLAVAA